MKTLIKLLTVCILTFAVVPAMGQSSEQEDSLTLNQPQELPLIYVEERPQRQVLGSEIEPRNPNRKRRLTRRLIAPKGDWQAGVSIMYADFDASNSDYMLLLDGLNAKASMLKIAPEASYTFAKNHALGAKFTYTRVSGLLDQTSLDLLGNLSLSVGNVNATSSAMGGSIYQRTFVGIDKHGRFGLFWDYIFGYTRSKTQFSLGESSNSYTQKEKYSFSFAPGVIYYPMNNVSIHMNISIFDLAYINTKAYTNEEFVGEHFGCKANASLNLLNLSFGLAVHL